MATDFTMQQHVDPASIAALAQRQAEDQARMDEQASQQKMQMIQQVAQGVGSMVSASIEASKKRQKDDMVKNLANSMANRVPNVMAPQQGPGLPDASGNEQPLPPVSTPDTNTQNAVRASVQLDQTPWTKQLADQLIQSPNEKAQMDMNTQKAAQEQANAAKLNQGIQPATLSLIKAAHDKLGLPPPDPAQFGNMKEQDAQTYLGNAAKLNSQTGNAQTARAEIMKQNTIAKLNDQMSKKMNPANWGPNSMAGKSAALVANADSAINLADQMLTGKIPTTEQTMTSLALDANRVLTQVGVPSEKTTAELKAKTGFSSFASALQYFTAHPEDQKLQPFAQLLKTEVSRQRDQRQSIVDRTLAGEFASLNQLKRLSPQDWEDQVTANGFDLEAAKKGKLKIRPEVGSTMYGWDIGDSSKKFEQPAAAGAQGGDIHALAGILGLKKKAN